MKNYIAVITAAFILLANGVFAQSPKGAESLRPQPVSEKVEAPSNVQGNGTLLQSGIKSLGKFGKTKRYEVVQVKVRGLDTPNVAGFLVYDEETDSVVAAQTGGAPGLGVAIVNGGSYVAGNYLFGSKLRPNNQNINGGDVSSTSNGGSSSATGGSSSATGGNSSATGGNATVNGPGPKTPKPHNPPGHQPGHGQPGHGND